jgi:hypothetical protein
MKFYIFCSNNIYSCTSSFSGHDYCSAHQILTSESNLVILMCSSYLSHHPYAKKHD